MLQTLLSEAVLSCCGDVSLHYGNVLQPAGKQIGRCRLVTGRHLVTVFCLSLCISVDTMSDV